MEGRGHKSVPIEARGVQSSLEICQQNRERTGETWESAQSVGSDEIKGDVSVK